MLCDTAKRFQRKFQKDGSRSGCGGSFLFVMIFYLDHLHRVPVKWGVYPRVKVWNSGEVKAAVIEDKVASDEYGKLLAVDVAYGEEHPLVPRESSGVNKKGQLSGDHAFVDDVVDRVLAQLSTRLVSVVESVVARTVNSGYDSKLTKTNPDQFEEEVHTILTAKGSNPRTSTTIENNGPAHKKNPEAEEIQGKRLFIICRLN